MKSSKPLGRCVCGPMMVLLVSFLATEGSSAADTIAEKKITKLFLTSGQVDLAREVVRLPLHRGRLSSGETVWFVLTDVSDFATSQKMGLTWAPSLSKTRDLASTRVAEMDESNNFTFRSGRVDFSPTQALTAGAAPNFFPPRMARAGSVGDAHYGPLVRVANRNDIIFNAPIIAFNDPERQGLNSALSGEGPTLDILARFTELSAGYSPMWDVQLAEWTKEAIEGNQRELITNGDDIVAKSEAGLLESPGGGPVKSIGNLVNCPVVGFTNE